MLAANETDATLEVERQGKVLSERELRKRTLSVDDRVSDYYGFQHIQDAIIDGEEAFMAGFDSANYPPSTAGELDTLFRHRKLLTEYVVANPFKAYYELSRHYDGVRCRVGQFTVAHALVCQALEELGGELADEKVAELDIKRDHAQELARFTLSWVQ